MSSTVDPPRPVSTAPHAAPDPRPAATTLCGASTPDGPHDLPFRPGPHRTILILSVAVLGAAFLFDVRPDARIAFRFAPEHPLPHVCASRLLFDLPCPGCGLTRSFVRLAHGDLVGSFAEHRLGPAFVLLFALQIPYRLAILARRREFLPRGTRDRVMCMLLAFLFGNWLLAFVLPS